MAVHKHEYDDEEPEHEEPLAIKISPALRRRIAKIASNSNQSIDEYIEHVLEHAVQLEEDAPQASRKPLTEGQLALLLRTQEQIAQHTQGQIFEEPADVINRMREERNKEI